ncbi:PREDICTED: uncharacterized protein LOC103327505 [Prunus mume]|uniref:Uncharacterized protein LOC103327505 n=1 Tax=Prunus mume TaxID=102107 RepID=A0ABM0NPY1_PRUMU|nr:PREDICTED: uncharacterized protein LOC103327505 [Prunus mume]
MTFCVGFIYLSSEREDNYVWALSVLRRLMDEIAMPDVIVTDRELALMKAIDAVFDTSLNPYKDRFVAAWIDKCMHFGNTTSNRAEISHARLKRQLGTSQGTFATTWENIHASLELQHTEIKVSFEESLIVVHHDFRSSDFEELRGFVSSSALYMVLEETKLANNYGIDSEVCGCLLRLTHVLPCAHEIVKYKKDGKPIPLECIDPHWRQLDMTCALKRKTSECSYDAEMKLFHRRWMKSDATTQMILRRKLMELVAPQTTLLVKPFVNTKTRGRPGKKMDKSTRRDPSLFEVVDSPRLDGCSLSGIPPKVSAKQKRQPKERPVEFVDAFPQALRSCIHHVKDVATDGHCGYRAIAALLGYGEDGWVQVRSDLLNELESYSVHYSALYGYENRVYELKHSLAYFGPDANFDRWMTMPDMGHIIASCYDVVFLKPSHPIPHIATNWDRYREPWTTEWATPYITRIQQFIYITRSTVITRETIAYDDD